MTCWFLILFSPLFGSAGLQDLEFPARLNTGPSAVIAWSPNHWTTKQPRRQKICLGTSWRSNGWNSKLRCTRTWVQRHGSAGNSLGGGSFFLTDVCKAFSKRFRLCVTYLPDGMEIRHQHMRNTKATESLNNGESEEKRVGSL